MPYPGYGVAPAPVVPTAMPGVGPGAVGAAAGPTVENHKGAANTSASVVAAAIREKLVQKEGRGVQVQLSSKMKGLCRSQPFAARPPFSPASCRYVAVCGPALLDCLAQPVSEFGVCGLPQRVYRQSCGL